MQQMVQPPPIDKKRRTHKWFNFMYKFDFSSGSFFRTPEHKYPEKLKQILARAKSIFAQKNQSL
jgi:hypothetical protein